MVGMWFATKIQTRFCFQTRRIEWFSWNLSGLKTKTLPSVIRYDALPTVSFFYFELSQLDHGEFGNKVVGIVLLWDLLRWILEAELPLWRWQSGSEQVRFIVWSMSNLIKSSRVCSNYEPPFTLDSRSTSCAMACLESLRHFVSIRSVWIEKAHWMHRNHGELNPASELGKQFVSWMRFRFPIPLGM